MDRRNRTCDSDLPAFRGQLCWGYEVAFPLTPVAIVG